MQITWSLWCSEIGNFVIRQVKKCDIFHILKVSLVGHRSPLYPITYKNGPSSDQAQWRIQGGCFGCPSTPLAPPLQVGLVRKTCYAILTVASSYSETARLNRTVKASARFRTQGCGTIAHAYGVDVARMRALRTDGASTPLMKILDTPLKPALRMCINSSLWAWESFHVFCLMSGPERRVPWDSFRWDHTKRALPTSSSLLLLGPLRLVFVPPSYCRTSPSLFFRKRETCDVDTKFFGYANLCRARGLKFF